MVQEGAPVAGANEPSQRSFFTHLKRVDDSGVDEPQSALIERRLFFHSGSAEIRQHLWARPKSCIWRCERYLLSFALTKRRESSWVVYLDTSSHVKHPVGQTILVPARRTVQSGGPQGHERSLTCTISAELFDRMLPERSGWSEVALANGLCLTDGDVQWLLTRIYREVSEDQFGGAVVVESLISALTVAIIRKLGLDTQIGPVRSGGLPPWKMKRIRERVFADLPSPSIAELAELCDISIRHLTRTFKMETGKTVAEFIQEAAIERARQLLIEGEAPIADIARVLGFATSTGFSNAFRRATGMVPSDIGRRRRTSKRTC